MDNPYTSVPLDLKARQIRIVELCPSPDEEEIICKFHVFPLEGSRPEYVALSYTWGDDAPYRDIELDGHRFSTRRNLWWFLHRRRKQGQNGYFWIDAICIDQFNGKERNHQVQMMRDVYSNAQSVSVWLGEAEDGSDLAISYLAKREPLSAHHNVKRALDGFWEQGLAILQLCKRDYWNRIWIIQEIMKARQITVYCGSEKISWQKLEELFHDLHVVKERKPGALAYDLKTSRNTGWISKNRGEARRFSHSGLSMLRSPAFNIVRTKSTWDGNKRPLMALMQIYHGHQASNFRDKVYALQGLAKESSTIPVDYEIDKDLLFLRVLHQVVISFAEENLTKGKIVQFGVRIAEAMDIKMNSQSIEEHVSMVMVTGQPVQPREIATLRFSLKWSVKPSHFTCDHHRLGILYHHALYEVPHYRCKKCNWIACEYTRCDGSTTDGLHDYEYMQGNDSYCHQLGVSTPASHECSCGWCIYCFWPKRMVPCGAVCGAARCPKTTFDRQKDWEYLCKVCHFPSFGPCEFDREPRKTLDLRVHEMSHLGGYQPHRSCPFCNGTFLTSDQSLRCIDFEMVGLLDCKHSTGSLRYLNIL